MIWTSDEIDEWFDGDVDAAREQMRFERDRAQVDQDAQVDAQDAQDDDVE